MERKCICRVGLAVRIGRRQSRWFLVEYEQQREVAIWNDRQLSLVPTTESDGLRVHVYVHHKPARSISRRTSSRLYVLRKLTGSLGEM